MIYYIDPKPLFCTLTSDVMHLTFDIWQGLIFIKSVKKDMILSKNWAKNSSLHCSYTWSTHMNTHEKYKMDRVAVEEHKNWWCKHTLLYRIRRSLSFSWANMRTLAVWGKWFLNAQQ